MANRVPFSWETADGRADNVLFGGPAAMYKIMLTFLIRTLRFASYVLVMKVTSPELIGQRKPERSMKD